MNNKVAIVTGASSGIGKSCAEELVSRGATVVITGRNEEKLLQVADELRKKGGEILSFKMDVSILEDCENLIEATIEKYGKIDILINNAGISMRALFNEVDLKVIKNLMDINFWGTVYCTKFALPHLLKTKGSVIAVSSIAGFKGLPARTGYSASKFAIHGFLESLRIENLKKGLHVLIACPGFTASNIRKTALNKDGIAQGESPREEDKMMSPDEVAIRIVDAIKSRKRSLVLTSQGRMTVFINKFFPGWLDKKVYDHMAKEPDSPLS